MTSKLPPGAHSAAIPGSRANAALKGAPVPKPVVIDPKRFGAIPGAQMSLSPASGMSK